MFSISPFPVLTRISKYFPSDSGMGGVHHGVQSVQVMCLFFLVILFHPCFCSVQTTRIPPGFNGSQMEYIDNDGLILLSRNSNFVFGFQTLNQSNTTAFLLVVKHRPTSVVVWTANRESPVSNSDIFVFTKDGNAYLESGGNHVWSTKTTGQGGTGMVLLDTGNLVLLGSDNTTSLWQSFDHPTDTLLPGQSFGDGMLLVSERNPNTNLSCSLRIGSGDMTLQAEFPTPQPYWSISGDSRTISVGVGKGIYSATLENNSWSFYDQKHVLLSQFIISTTQDGNDTWAAVLGSDGFISFNNLQQDASLADNKVPQGDCNTPEACSPYYICSSGRSCSCPTALSSSGCNPNIAPCGSSKGSTELVEVQEKVDYFAIGFSPPATKSSNLTGCKDACTSNCSCLALFFNEKLGNCYLFDQIGSLRQPDTGSNGYACYLKISTSGSSSNGGQGGGGSAKHLTIIITISIVTAVIVAALVYAAVWFHRRKTAVTEPSQPLVSSDEDDFLDTISGMPVRFSYRELKEATENFSVKLGGGGFGSVYQGKLPDGTRIAVKKLEGIGQGKKEFRAEVSIIGRIHHVHLVRLRGFCAEGTHRLLAYEFMANGSLEKWIFRHNKDGFPLDWDKRFNIALGTAKGLAYLHEDCDSKIVHCDIKPENVLLDDNFVAKVSDFGLARLMTREQSQVVTTLRGTRGYLAPEWIINSALSEKSDVYSFGMVLLEIVGGRKNFDPSQSSEKAHFPSYAFKKMEEGKLKEILDANLQNSREKDDRVETAIKVALWCIQEDMSKRPSMTKVVQMLEGISDVSQPPISGQMGFRLYANLYKSISEEGSSSLGAPSDWNSDAFLSAVRLSGPR